MIREHATKDLTDYVVETLGDTLIETITAFGELTLIVAPADIVRVLTFLRDDPQTQFINLVDICGVDYPERAERFEVVYHLLSPRQNQRIRIKVRTGVDTPVPSVTGVFAGADWFEREAYDFYGILFTGHPDLRRILTDYGFEGYPLRKDFPVLFSNFLKMV